MIRPRLRRSLVLALFVAGCSPDVGPRSTLTAPEAEAARAACSFGPGTLPGLSLAKDAPLGEQIPIDHVVVVMMENRSFDHLLQNLPAYGQPDADVAPAGYTNPDAKGQAVAPWHMADTYCFEDTDHEWEGTRVQWNGGKRDGFVLSNTGARHDPEGRRAMGYYTEEDIPFLYWAASTFALGDRYFCSALGPTYVNRLFLYAGTSFGITDNILVQERTRDLMVALEDAKVPWMVYHKSLPGAGVLIQSTARYLSKHFDELPSFFKAAEAGKLPAVTFVDPELSEAAGAVRDDFHPPGDVQQGDAFLARIVEAVIKSPQWPRTALFITFDEHGGLYDHVPPPAACPPDATPPMVANPADATPGFDRLGFRVPFIAISPWARPHHVSHTVYDHTSILRFIGARFRLPALTARDANAAPPFDLFDFSRPALTSVPARPAVVVDPAKLAACEAAFPPVMH